MQRPSRRESGVIKTAAERMAADIVKRWDPEGKAEEWEADLVKVIGTEHDAYRMARALERHGVDPDAELVDVLSDAMHHLDDAYRDAVELWVRFMNITPDRNVGDTVSWSSGREEKTGVITGMIEKQAQYVITPAGDEKFANGGGYMVDYEKVRDPAPGKDA